MKKRIKYIFIMLIFLLFTNKVNAMSVAKESLTVEPGSTENVEVYANFGEKQVTKVVFTLTNTSDDNDRTNFYAPMEYKDTENGNIHTTTFNENKSGRVYLGVVRIKTVTNPTDTRGEIQIKDAVATTVDGETITLNNANIIVNINKQTNNDNEEETTTTQTTTTTKKTTTTTTTTTTTKKTNKLGLEHLLKKINSNLVNIELRYNVYEYTIKVYKGTEELDLVPVPKDENTKIEISSQKLNESEKNQIIINTKNGDIEQIYTFNVKIVEKKTTQTVQIDNGTFVEKNENRGKWIIVIVILCALAVPTLLFAIKKK